MWAKGLVASAVDTAVGAALIPVLYLRQAGEISPECTIAVVLEEIPGEFGSEVATDYLVV